LLNAASTRGKGGRREEKKDSCRPILPVLKRTKNSDFTSPSHHRRKGKGKIKKKKKKE